MDHNSDDGVPGPDRLVAPKRRRMRASIACRLCRERKTRCDNRRPSCGYCRLHGATCHYPDGSRDSTLQSDENSSEVSNGTILGRVNEVLALLEQLKKDRANSEQRRPLDRSVSLGRTEETVLAHRHSQTADVFSNQEAPESAFADAGFGQLEIPHVAAQASACESILRWPILSDVMTRAGTSSSSDLRKASLSGTYEDNTHSSQKTAGVAHDSIINLCRRFLALIHIKNPILDVHEFSQHARNAAELGPGWDGGGCLVVRQPSSMKTGYFHSLDYDLATWLCVSLCIGALWPRSSTGWRKPSLQRSRGPESCRVLLRRRPEASWPPSQYISRGTMPISCWPVRQVCCPAYGCVVAVSGGMCSAADAPIRQAPGI
jgi:hypothetical protein